MRKNNVLEYIIFFLLIFILFSDLGAQENVKGFAYLRIGAGGRAAGMGEAFTAVSEGASATFWNPASINVDSKNSVLIAHNKWIKDISSNFLSFVFGKNRLKLGLSLYSNTVSDIEKRSKPSLTPEGLFSAADFYLGISASYPFTKKLRIGISIKYIYQKIYIEEASGYSTDFGVSYSFSNRLKLAAVLKNIGTVSILKNESTSLPALLRTGAAFRIPELINNIKILLSADIEKVFESKTYLYFGSEIDYKDTISLRTGYQYGYDARGLSYGIGVSVNSYNFDYGIQPFSYQMGTTHRISFYHIF